MKKILLFLLILLSRVAPAQTKYSSLPGALNSGYKLSGLSGPSSVNWMDDGRFSYKERNVIKLYNPASGKEEVIFDPAQFQFPGGAKAFSYASFEWSKDFKFIVFRTNITPVWRNSGLADYYIYSLVDKRIRLLVKQAYTAQLSPDGKKVGYEKNGNLFVMELATKKEKQLTSDAAKSFYNGRFGWAYEEEFGLVQAWEWSHDGKQIAYWQTDERKVPIYRYTDYWGTKENYEEIPYPRVGDPIPYMRIGVVNVETGKKQWMKVECGEGYIPRIYWTSITGQLAIVTLNRKQNDMQLYFADILTGRANRIFGEKSNTWLEVFSFGAGILHYLYFPKDAKEFFWKSERDGWSHIYRYDYSGKLINQVTKGPWEMVKVLYTDNERKRIYYLSTEESPLERHLYVIGFDGTGKKRLTMSAGNHSINFGGKYYIDTYSSVSLPKQVELHDADGSLVKKLETNESVKTFISEHFYAPKELSRFTTSDGQPIDISIVKPAGFDPAKKYPLLLDVYGGPEHQAVYNSFGANAWHQFLAQSGYVVVEVNNRGGAGYGARFKEVVYRNLGYWECHDFAEVAKFMMKQSWIDSSKIAIRGHSYGGFTAAYAILNYPDLFKAAIVGSPVSDWRLYDAIYTERFMGVLPESEAYYNKSSVLPYVKNLKGEMLIAHSTFDDNVHVRNTMQLLRALIDNGKDAELRLYQGGGHGIVYNEASYQLLMRQYTDFLNRNLLGSSF